MEGERSKREEEREGEEEGRRGGGVGKEAPELLALTPQNSLQTKHKVSNQVSRNAECGMAKWRRHEWRHGGDKATWRQGAGQRQGLGFLL